MHETYVVDRKIGVVPLDGVATFGLHDVEPFQHDRSHQVQAAKVEPLLVIKLTASSPGIRNNTRRRVSHGRGEELSVKAPCSSTTYGKGRV